MLTIREAKIVIHLEQGPVNLKAPDLSRMFADQQKLIDYAKQYEEQLKRVQQAQQAQQSAAGSGGGLGGGGNSGRGSGLAPGADEAAQAFDRLYRAQMRYLTAQQAIGEGFFLLARSAALFSSSSDESFDRLIRNLATVQAYFDFYKGFTNTIRGVVDAMKALQKAELEAAIASGNMTRAQIEALKSSQTLAAGIKMLAIAISDAAVVMVAITSVIAIVTSAYDILVTTEEEVKAANEGVRQAIEAKVWAMEEELKREKQLQDIRRQNMTDMEKAASLHHAVFALEGIEMRSWRARENSVVPGADLVLESENLKAVSAISDLQEEMNLRREILQVELRARDAKFDAIQQQERQLQMAERQLQIEQEKLQAFKSQIGALDPMQLAMLKDVDQKLKAGVELNPFELETLQRSGGERGRREADKIYAKRFDALGIDSETFLGGDGGGMKEAQKAVDELAKALRELTKGLTSVEAIAKLEAEKKELQAKYDKFRDLQIKFIETLIETMELNNDKINEIRDAMVKS